MKIKFRYFWANFNPSNNIFQQILNRVLIDEFHSAKFIIEIHSVFVRPRRIYFWYLPVQIYIRKILRYTFRRKIIYIWYTGELIAPPKGYDLTLSYAATDKNNIYWPLWATYVDYAAHGGKFDREHTPSIDRLMSQDPMITTDGRMWKACAFISNSIDWRFDVAKQLEALGLLDIYGKAVGKPTTTKSEIAQQYAFQFCFENQIQGLYVSEKPIEAWLDGNIPIYAGGADYEYINPSALIDCRKVATNEWINHIRLSMSDHHSAKSKLSTPILLKPYDYSLFIDFLREEIRSKFT